VLYKSFVLMFVQCQNCKRTQRVLFTPFNYVKKVLAESRPLPVTILKHYVV